MNQSAQLKQFLLLSRGQWDNERTPEEIQAAIDSFYAWHQRRVLEGIFSGGSRLSAASKLVTQSGTIDGPFTEAKEVIGGYWFITAESLDAAARIAAENPCLRCGLSYEIRQLEDERASAYRDSAETPVREK